MFRVCLRAEASHRAGPTERTAGLAPRGTGFSASAQARTGDGVSSHRGNGEDGALFTRGVRWHALRMSVGAGQELRQESV